MSELDNTIEDNDALDIPTDELDTAINSPQPMQPVKQPRKGSEWLCPECQSSVSFFINKGFGWCICPACKTKLHAKQLKEMMPGVPIKTIKGEKSQTPIAVKTREQRAAKRAALGVEMPAETEREEEETPFRRSKEPWLILQEVLNRYAVKAKAIEILVDRCKISPLSPAAVYRDLQRLETGLRKEEPAFLVEDYEVALHAQKPERYDYYSTAEPQDDYNPGWGGRFSNATPREPPHPSTRFSGDEVFRGRPPPPQNKNTGLTQADVMAIIHEQEDRRTKEDKIDRLESKIETLMEEILGMKNAPPPPPMSQQPVTQKDLLDAVREITATTELKNKDRYIDYLTKKSDDDKELTQKLLDKLEKRLEDAERRAYQQPLNTEGFQSDEAKILAQGIDVVAKKSPIRDAAKLFVDARVTRDDRDELADEKEIKKIKRGRKSREAILDQLPDDMVDDE